MTISKYIAEFIKLYENIVIDTNHVKDGSDKYGLFKSPSRDKTPYINGSSTITEYFQFYAMQNSISETERQEDDPWLENFVYWVDDYPLSYEYPAIDGGRSVQNISVSGCPTPFSDSDNGIMYQISLTITSEREE